MNPDHKIEDSSMDENKIKPTHGMMVSALGASCNLRGDNLKTHLEKIARAILNHPDAKKLFEDKSEAKTSLGPANVKDTVVSSLDEILPGDYVIWEKVTKVYDTKFTERREGVVHFQDGDGDWSTKLDVFVTDGDDGDSTIIVRRPIRELPKKDGTVIVPAKGHKNIVASTQYGPAEFDKAVCIDGLWVAINETGDTRAFDPEYIEPDTWQEA